jgi:uncharacterized protein (UPF0332 family)
MNEDLTIYFSQAEDSLQAARTLKSNGLFKGAVNHCYYAYFWIVRGLFLSKDIFTKTHTGVQSKFSEMFIATDLIPKKYGQYLAKLFKERQIADYELHGDFSQEDIDEYIAMVEDFMEFMKENYSKL